jgi:hypothetical protein
LELSRIKIQLPLPLPLPLPVLGVPMSCTQGTSGSSGQCGSLVAGGPQSSSAAAVLPQLQDLKLFDCKLNAQLLIHFLSVSGLSKLQWQHVQLFRDREGDLTEGEVYAILWQQLQLLPQLSELHHLDGRLTAADIAPLSTLQHLQHLNVRRLDYLWEGFGPTESGPTPLLAALQHLTQLQHLELNTCTLYLSAPQTQQQGGSYQCFSALTASTHLTALIIRGDYEPVPKAAFQHMFPAGWTLPDLQVLRLSSEKRKHCVEAAHIAMIAASCPALQEFCLWRVTAKGFDVSCLSQLPAGVTTVPGVTSSPGVEWCRPKN